MFRQIGSGYHYCQLVHGPLANFPHTKNSVLAVTTRRLELYSAFCFTIAALLPLQSKLLPSSACPCCCVHITMLS